MASRRQTTGFIDVKGINNKHLGYGRMFISLRDAIGEQATLSEDAELVVLMAQPFGIKGWWKGQKKAILTMWETDYLPAKFANHLSQYDIVLVPSEHNRAVFCKHHDNVHVVQLGIDTELWKPSEKGRKPGPIKFMAGGSHWTRKGLDAVVKAFSQFQASDVQLIIKTIPDMVGEIPKNLDPRITVIQENLDEIAERDLYRSADLFISASRGEGFGLMPLQAIAAGIPTLLSDTSGHREFIHLASRQIATTPKEAAFPPFYTKGIWDEPDVQSILDGMTWFMDNRKEARAMMPELSAKAREFTWARSAQQLLDATGTSGLLKEKIWEPATEAKVTLMVKKRVRADIGKFSVDLAPGIEHLVPVNVKDVIVEAGLAVEGSYDY